VIDSVVSAQTRAMIGQLQRYESEQVGAILERGHAHAKDIVTAAYAQARASVRKGVERERRRREQEQLKARAREETRERLATQLRVRRLLAMGWALLPDVLISHWQDATARRRWCRSALGEARRRLLGERFTVEHAPGLSPVELDDMQGECPGRKLDFVSATDLRAGLRVRTQGACLDASIESLLADPAHIESLLLAAYQEQVSGEQESGSA